MQKEKMKEIQLTLKEAQIISALDLSNGPESLPCNDGSFVECETLAVALYDFLFGVHLICVQIADVPDGTVILMDEERKVFAQSSKSEIESRKKTIDTLFRKLYPTTYSKLHFAHD